MKLCTKCNQNPACAKAGIEPLRELCFRCGVGAEELRRRIVDYAIRKESDRRMKNREIARRVMSEPAARPTEPA